MINIDRLRKDDILWNMYTNHNCTEEELIKYGYMEDKRFDMERFELITSPNFLCTSTEKLKSPADCKKPVVLLTTGGFYPLHDGHLYMMESAKERLEKEGFDVIGGYISPCNDEYARTKLNMFNYYYDRVEHITEVLSNNNWIDIDVWEAMYSNLNCSFTEVLQRLERFLQYTIDKRIEVVYVYGEDNCDFSIPLDKSGRHSVCVNRYSEDNFCDTKTDNNLKNTFYVNINPFGHLSSRYIRLASRTHSQTLKGEANHSAKILLRIDDPQLLFTESIKNKIMEFAGSAVGIDCLANKVDKLVEQFFRNLQYELSKYYIVKDVHSSRQVKEFNKLYKNSNILSLDSILTGDNVTKIEMSRYFNLASRVSNPISMGTRPEKENISDTLKSIDKSKKYILVDDDSSTGKTISDTLKLCQENGVIIEDVVMLTSLVVKSTDTIFDVLDARDFLVGMNNSGLVVTMPDGETARVPYLEPYVNLNKRASIPIRRLKKFSKAVLRHNRTLLEDLELLNITVNIEDCSESFKTFALQAGYKRSDKLLKFINDNILINI